MIVDNLSLNSLITSFKGEMIVHNPYTYILYTKVSTYKGNAND